MITDTREVGNHHVNGQQLHVPKVALGMMDLAPGDEVEMAVTENGCLITPVEDEDPPSDCAFCNFTFPKDWYRVNHAHIEDDTTVFLSADCPVCDTRRVLTFNDPDGFGKGFLYNPKTP